MTSWTTCTICCVWGCGRSRDGSAMTGFTCNICGTRNRAGQELGREVASCSTCGSSVRTRDVVHVLALELFGIPVALGDFPRVKSLRGIGMSDPAQYADGLARKF